MLTDLHIHSKFSDGTLPMKNDYNKPAKSKILIADDERDLVNMVGYNLEKKGYEIIKAYDGFEAWKMIEAESPDLIILDLMMPELDGWEICRLLRQSRKETLQNLGILMLTARAMPEDRVSGLELGADDYLTKPFSLSELMLRVDKIVQKRKAISELHEEMSELRLDVKSKDENLRSVVHDLKAPLITMGASAGLLLRDPDHDKKTKFLQNIFENSVRLTHWVEDILKYYQLFSQGLGNETKRIDISALVKQGVERLWSLSEEKQIEISYSPSLSTPTIRGNESLLERAIENLIANAIKYTPAGGKVKVGVISYQMKEGGGVTEISVKDTGIGIDVEDLERIFDPFFRGKNGASEAGIGLGLSLVKEVVDLHGGRILVQSDLTKGVHFQSYYQSTTIREKRRWKKDFAKM